MSHSNGGIVLARKLLVVLAMIVVAKSARAQHGGGPPPDRTAPPEAAQFNFLVGQWDLVVKPAAVGLGQKVHGTPKLIGTWKAWREFDGWGVEDELRITDGSGNPIGLSHAMRYYDATAKKWKSVGLDVYRGAISNAVAEMRGTVMVSNSSGRDPEGKAYLSRARYADITPNSFTFLQERSTDNGKTWDESLTIEAKRTASLAPRN
jgi:hypothetical protein